MDEYDELFEIEDNFEDQFADELEVLAQMDRGEDQLANKVSLTPGPVTDIIFSSSGRLLHRSLNSFNMNKRIAPYYLQHVCCANLKTQL